MGRLQYVPISADYYRYARRRCCFLQDWEFASRFLLLKLMQKNESFAALLLCQRQHVSIK